MAKRTFRQDPVTLEFYEVTPRTNEAPYVIADTFTPFRSPRDGTVIESRSQLHDYMAKHDLVFHEDAKTQRAEGDRYAEKRSERALRERLWEHTDRLIQTGRGPSES
jgi:hypothetical protein